jgi:tRNA A37 threonylcarbamoyladenosine modification protein TsaB
MKILIRIENKKVRIILKDSRKETDFLDIKDEYRLSEDLLSIIEKLLERNKKTAQDVEGIEVKSDRNDSFTTTRIAKTVAKAWSFAKSV